MSINLPEIEQARREMVAAAQAMLDGHMSFIEGSRRILSLREDARIPDSDPDILPFNGVCSETDALPIGNRAMWSAEALARLQPEIDRKEKWAADFARPYCQRLIDRYGIPFTFGLAEDVRAESDFVLPIPEGIQAKETLFSHYESAGQFPGYFGRNWDALYDCLSDFSWTDRTRIVITHKDLPLLGNDKELWTYLDILRNVVAEGQSDGRRKSLVIFPLDTENEVARILSDCGRA